MESERDKLLNKLISGDFGLEGRIITWKTKHNGQEIDCYVPQINIGADWTPENGYNKWIDVLPKGCYILKESSNPIDICKKCDGDGCKDCNDRGFKKGTPVDLKYIAQLLLESRTKEIINAQKTLTEIGFFKTRR